MNIYIMRHGDTAWTSKESNDGMSDMPLNEAGKARARETAHYIDDLEIDVIFCSPFTRTRQTAEIVAKGRQIIVDDRIKEINFGDVVGVTYENRKEVFNKILDNSNGDFLPANAESFPEMETRIAEFFDEIQDKYKTKNVLVITHAGISRVIRRYFWGFPKDRNYSIFSSPQPCEIVKLK